MSQQAQLQVIENMLTYHQQQLYPMDMQHIPGFHANNVLQLGTKSPEIGTIPDGNAAVMPHLNLKVDATTPASKHSNSADDYQRWPSCGNTPATAPAQLGRGVSQPLGKNVSEKARRRLELEMEQPATMVVGNRMSMDPALLSNFDDDDFNSLVEATRSVTPPSSLPKQKGKRKSQEELKRGRGGDGGDQYSNRPSSVPSSPSKRKIVKAKIETKSYQSPHIFPTATATATPISNGSNRRSLIRPGDISLNDTAVSPEISEHLEAMAMAHINFNAVVGETMTPIRGSSNQMKNDDFMLDLQQYFRPAERTRTIPEPDWNVEDSDFVVPAPAQEIIVKTEKEKTSATVPKIRIVKTVPRAPRQTKRRSKKNLMLLEGEDERPTRMDNSLLMTTKKFLALRETCPVLNLNDAAEKLSVPKRRLYDITNVLEGIDLVEKVGKNSIRWKVASDQDLQLANELRQDLEDLNREEERLEKLEHDIRNAFKLVKEDPVDKPYAYTYYDELRAIPVLAEKTLIAIKSHAHELATLTLSMPPKSEIGEETFLLKITSDKDAPLLPILCPGVCTTEPLVLIRGNQASGSMLTHHGGFQYTSDAAASRRSSSDSSTSSSSDNEKSIYNTPQENDSDAANAQGTSSSSAMVLPPNPMTLSASALQQHKHLTTPSNFPLFYSPSNQNHPYLSPLKMLLDPGTTHSGYTIADAELPQLSAQEIAFYDTNDQFTFGASSNMTLNELFTNNWSLD